jgi:peroxiredoxin
VEEAFFWRNKHLNRRIYILLAAGALALWGIFTLLQKDFQSGPDIGKLAPDFQLPALAGGDQSLASYRGKAVILNFWATWCEPCRQEMPSLEALYQRYKDRGLVVVGVSVDEDEWDSIREFLKLVPVTFPILLDKEQKVTELYETFRIPETYFINPQGEVAGKVVGPQDYDEEVFYKKVERILPASPLGSPGE